MIEIEFSIGTRDYKVIRGIKPNKFEIYQNGKMMNQEANVRDYQRILEQQILKLNYRSFTQVVILGSSTFIPFMQLKSHTQTRGRRGDTRHQNILCDELTCKTTTQKFI